MASIPIAWCLLFDHDFWREYGIVYEKIHWWVTRDIFRIVG